MTPLFFFPKMYDPPVYLGPTPFRRKCQPPKWYPWCLGTFKIKPRIVHPVDSYLSPCYVLSIDKFWTYNVLLARASNQGRNQTSSQGWARKWRFIPGLRAKRAGVQGAEPPVGGPGGRAPWRGSRGQSPRRGSRGRSPRKLKGFSFIFTSRSWLVVHIIPSFFSFSSLFPPSFLSFLFSFSSFPFSFPSLFSFPFLFSLLPFPLLFSFLFPPFSLPPFFFSPSPSKFLPRIFQGWASRPPRPPLVTPLLLTLTLTRLAF